MEADGAGAFGAPDDAALDGLVDGLAEWSWAVTDALFPADLVRALREQAHDEWQRGAYRAAGVGTGSERLVRTELRSDHVRWLDPTAPTPPEAAYFARIDALRQRLNRALYLGLRDVEAHLAVYPPGASYGRHLDRFKASAPGHPERVVSCVCYLNEGWQPAYGGLLRLYEPDDAGAERAVDVAPEGGRFVCFLSDAVPHEVLPATRERYSLTGWMRR